MPEATRGIVSGRRVRSLRAGAFQVDATSRADLLRYLTYWDVVDMPDVQAIGPGVPDVDLDLLRREGVVRTTSVSYDAPAYWPLESEGTVNGMPPSVLALVHVQAAFDVADRGNATENVVWSVGQNTLDSAAELDWPTSQRRESHGLVCTLHDALPVPHPDVAVEDLLAFRARRRPELLQFRAAMDGLYDSIERAENTHTAVVRALERLEAESAVIHRLLDESKLAKLLGGLKVYLDLGEFNATKVLFPALGAAASGLVTVNPGIGALAGLGLHAAYTFATRKVRPPHPLPEGHRDFAYLYYARKLEP